jgi:hypothetical protein
VSQVSDVKKHIEESQGAAFPAKSLVVIASGKVSFGLSQSVPSGFVLQDWGS